jgi:biotin carboxylase
MHNSAKQLLKNKLLEKWIADGYLVKKYYEKKIAKIFDLSPDVRNTIIASGKARALKAMDIKKSYLATLKMLIDTNI